jgi:hypothetical protein
MRAMHIHSQRAARNARGIIVIRYSVASLGAPFALRRAEKHPLNLIRFAPA